ncbi:MAG: 3-methyl-2-oxobutanoate dehydrogenase subunit beta, partial [Dysgonamonadaceae bacterium]|nr:3-methyl-2-oxobutanoate dehydrogenase subunit beta [Dysgonamonadaceae bacterium]
EMADFVTLGFDLAFKYRTPAMILSDGVIGQMMEKVRLPELKARRSEQEIRKQCPWATLGRTPDRAPNFLSTLEMDSSLMEQRNIQLQAKYKEIQQNEVRYQDVQCDDADYLLVAFGSAARICLKTVDMARDEGLKVGLLRPITLWPFPSEILAKYAGKVKGMLTVELNAGQMVEDVRLAVNGKVPVEHYGRLGGIVPTPDNVLEALKNLMGC